MVAKCIQVSYYTKNIIVDMCNQGHQLKQIADIRLQMDCTTPIEFI